MMRLTLNTGCERTASGPVRTGPPVPDPLGGPTEGPRDLVTPYNACPSCGERDMDRLMWEDDGENVRCATCGTIYNPSDRT